ncbi:MAG: isocitrate dehydrogenase [Planctomycetes bacterium]|nr:isocitrate dehydrogenase [Planctomycetota bacterium]
MLAPAMNTYQVVELLGDGISPELSRSVHALADVLPCRIEFTPVDLSEPNRRARGAALYDEAVELMKRHRLAIKYPTATTAESPNQVLRDLCDFAVIHRPVATLPGIENNFKKTIDIDVVRIATGGTYEDAGRRIGNECAVSVRVIERQPAAHAARFAFQLAAAQGKSVVSTSKWTIQKATDGLFEEVVDGVRAQFPAVQHRRELFDSLLAGLIMKPERYSVIVCPNEYGDFLSDQACGLIGSIGLGDSASYAFDAQGAVRIAMFDPAGGTAPDIAGMDLCNPMAALLALTNLLRHAGEAQASTSLRAVLLECLAQRCSTRDVGGTLGTSTFTAEVARRFQARLAHA